MMVKNFASSDVVKRNDSEPAKFFKTKLITSIESLYNSKYRVKVLGNIFENENLLS